MKKCKRCKKSFPLTEFYKHKAMADGYLSFCKSCTKKRVKNHRVNNPEKIKEYEKERSKDPKRIESQKEIGNKWKIDHPKARKAHNILNGAKRSGKIKSKPCKVCGDKNVHAHHCDYNKPLDVMWLCPKHHKEWHMKNEPIF